MKEASPKPCSSKSIQDRRCSSISFIVTCIGGSKVLCVCAPTCILYHTCCMTADSCCPGLPVSETDFDGEFSIIQITTNLGFKQLLIFLKYGHGCFGADPISSGQ